MLVLPNVWDAARARGSSPRRGSPPSPPRALPSPPCWAFPTARVHRGRMFAANERVGRAVAVPVSMDAEGGSDSLPPTWSITCWRSVSSDATSRTPTTGRRPGRRRGAGSLALGGQERRERCRRPRRRQRQGRRLPAGERRPGRGARRRGSPTWPALRAAGADFVYPIGVGDEHVLSVLVSGIDGPVNANTSATLDLQRLRALGVARVSYGPTFYRTALADLDRAVRALG